MCSNPFVKTVLAAVVFAAASTGCETIASADPNALWDIVHLDCVPAAQNTGKTGLCANVNLTQHYALLKDRNGVAQHLLIPTERVTGIESPLLLGPAAPNYWADAWTARSFVEASLKKPLPDNLLGLEVNSKYRRSQEQLHIHIDCMHADASAELESHRSDPPGQWTWDTIGGSRYRIMRVTGPAFDVDPFDIVARDRAGSDQMGMQTILVTGAGPTAANDGWLILNSGTDVTGGSGSAEPLLDHACAVAHR
ncbi:CDP-diacylglycerol diphosphatase [Trinickia violacea]|uniref:CDP-diacylglycerol pyrophosphatase n=1 Tax=Trinickia violacea TaxID=2571746 RepID=A0A4P8J0A2_9BURK|nr:CDP-diacylglycerol diphosphatase [Trinickia violacea]QCP53313.1 CDP-diacylglycerol diphosphatase [Trinickia violacea]